MAVFLDLLRRFFCHRDFCPAEGRSVNVCGFGAAAGKFASSSGSIFKESGTVHGPLDVP